MGLDSKKEQKKNLFSVLFQMNTVLLNFLFIK